MRRFEKEITKMQSNVPSVPTTAQQAPAAKKEETKKPPKQVPPPEFQAEKILKLDAPALVDLLKDPKTTVFEKAKACQRLANVGTKDAVPALAALLTHPQLGHYARYGLETIPDPAVDDALCEALRKLKGRPLVGVINSTAKRKDQKAVPLLTKLLYGIDIEVAKAAASALGHISGLEAMKALQGGLARTKGAVRDAVAAGGVLCAEGLLAGGQRPQALALYSALSRDDIPKVVRIAAMHGIIAAEVSLNRPR
jgi:HEAT repeat protein